MITRLLALTLLFPLPLLACGGSGGDIPGPGCISSQIQTPVIFSPPMTAGSGELVQCIPRAPSISSEGAVSCLALHATRATACACPADQGLQEVTAEHKSAIGKFLDPKTGTQVEASCVCEVKQLTGSSAAELTACQQDATSPLLDGAGKPINGYCYVDSDHPSSNPELVSQCANNERRALRFVGRPAVQQLGDLSAVLICVAGDCAATGE